ncbi:MAG: MBL fold metallo-hydrolase, partial [Alphaproteobacteria bacterium]|nr:MBL fold metallo-hydrolase [Alphaproteobacteria bacterium]MCY4504160.1 MBL fold metallo-hydrolase [Alphaproteobacteria bacterium]
FHRPLDLHQQSFAIGEAIAHLHNLWHAGRVERERSADDVFRFVQA